MRKIKRISPARPRRVVRELTPEEKQDKALIAKTLASREALEGQLRRHFFLAKGGCAPDVKDFRDSLIAQGYPERAANMEAWSEWLRMNDYKPTRQKDPYTEK